MSSGTPSENSAVAGIHVRQARDVTLRAGGDIVAGDKTTIHNYYGPKPQDITKAPYKFLSYYDIGDRDIFFGRDAVVEELAGEIPRHKVLIVNGQSGSGKTSLINAGLIPRLAENGYLYVYFRDYTNPLAQLREYFRDHPDFAFPDAEKLSLLQILRTIRSQQESPVVVIFDQFERFLINVAAEPRREFLQQLRECLESDLTADELNLVISLRDDFFGKLLLEAEAIIPTFGTDSHHHNLRTLNRDEARQAIIQPLKNIPNIGFDGKFVDDVLLPHLMGASGTDCQSVLPETKIEPPHLQIVCNQLYESARDRYRQQLDDGEPVRIGFDLYHALGETEGMLRDYLDDVVRRITNGNSEQMALVRSTLKLMIETVGTRRFQSLDDISTSLPGVARDEAERIIQKLQESRVVEAKQSGNETEFSLSHEFMVAKVQSWYDEREMERRRAEETLERGLVAWNNTRSVLDQQQLQLVDRWAPSNLRMGGTTELLDASRHRLRRQMWLKRSALVAMIAASALMPIAVIFWRVSVHKTQEAELSERKAISQLVTSKLELADAAQQRGDLSSSAFWYWDALDVIEPSDSRKPGVRNLFASWLRRSGRRLPFGIQVSCTAFSPDGRLLVTGSDDGALHIWDSHDGESMGDSVNVESPANTIVFSHDGKFLGMKCDDNRIRLWNTATRKQIGNALQHDAGAISDISCSVDGHTVALASNDNHASLWNVDTGQAISDKMEHLNPVDSVDFSPDGHRIVTGSFGQVKCWDVDGPKLLWEARSPGRVVAFSPDGNIVLSCGGSPPNQSIKQWDASIGTEFDLRELRLESEVTNGGFSVLVMSLDGSRLIAGGNNGSQGGGYALLWNAITAEPIGPPLRHDSIVVSAAFTPDGRSLLTGTSTGEVRVWDATVGEPCQETIRQEHSISSSAFSCNGKSVLIRQADTVQLFDVSTGNATGKPIQQSGFTQPLASSSDNQTFLIGDWDRTVKLWNATSGSQVGKTITHDDTVVGAAFSYDGAMFVTATRNGLVQAWDSATGLRKGKAIQATGQIETVDISSDGHTALIGCVNGECSSWDVESGNMLTRVRPHSGKVRAVALSPDGQIALTGSVDKTARLWNVSTGQSLGEPLLHEAEILSAAFSPDGRTALTGSRDGIARLWDVESGKLRGEWLRHFGRRHERSDINAVAFSEDGELAITGGNDGVVRLWKITPQLGLSKWEAEPLRAFVEWQTGYTKHVNGRRGRLSRDEWVERSRRIAIEGRDGGDSASLR